MWFSANLLFKSSVPDGRQLPPLCEASIRLIKADSKEDAVRKAEQIGGKAEHSYVNQEGNMVKWEFVKLLEIQELCESSIYDGIEVYSRMFYEKDK